MKTIRNIAIVVGVSLVLFALAATGAKAQLISNPSFSGTFTLPVETHWGAMALPAGDYRLEYGKLLGGTQIVAVADKARGRTLGVLLPGSWGDASDAENALVCIREGNKLYVRTLEMPLIGGSVHFKIPHGGEVESKLIAKHQSKNGNTRIAEVRINVERVPVKLSAQ